MLEKTRLTDQMNMSHQIRSFDLIETFPSPFPGADSVSRGFSASRNRGQPYRAKWSTKASIKDPPTRNPLAAFSRLPGQ